MKFLVNTVNTNYVKNLPVECLLNNFIDDEFQSSYKPLNSTDSLFLNSKFTIMKNFITPNTIGSYLKSLIGAMFQITLHVYRFFYYNYTIRRFVSSSVIPSLMLSMEVLYITATVLLYTYNILQSKNSVLLMIKIQQALNAINLEKEIILKQHKLWNWVNIVVIFSIYVAYAGITVVASLALGRGLYSLQSILISFPDMIFDIGIIYVTRTMYFIGNILGTFNRKIAIHIVQDDTRNEGGYSKALFQAYMNLMESFRLCKSVFQFVILFQVIQIFFQILITLQIIIEFGSFGFENTNNMYVISARIVSTLWNSKNIILLINLSVACKRFYEQVRIAEESCMQVLDSAHNRDLRRLCKNVLRHNRTTFRKLSACGVFAVDAALPVRLLAVILTYTVVLLQFAFLSH